MSSPSSGTTPGTGTSTPAVVPFEGEAGEWDAFVRDRPGASFCHLAGWREIMSDVLGNEVLYRVAVDDGGRWTGALPLVRVKSAIFGHHLVSMPFLNYGGPVGTGPARRALARAAEREARSSDADLLELRSRTPMDEPPLEVSHRKITVVLDLPESVETLWRDDLRSKVRSQVRRPMKEGMEARFGSHQVDAFYEVFSHHMRDLGTPVLPRELFERLARVFPERVEFGAIYHDGRPLAVGCGFTWDDEFEITWASALYEYSRMAPNMLLYWAFMKRCVERGIRRFNFGRCTPGGGTHRFKSQWGGDDEPLPWLRWSPRGVEGTPTPDEGLYRYATEAWKRLPLAVANRIGPLLSRRIP